MSTTDHADAVQLLRALQDARLDEARVRHQRSRGEAGYSDLRSAEYRTALAMQRCRDAGVIVDRVTIDTGALVSDSRADSSVGT